MTWLQRTMLDFSSFRSKRLPTNRIPFSAALLGLLCYGISSSTLASSCHDSLAVSGGLISGKSYKVATLLPGVSPHDVYNGAYRFVVKEGWHVQQGDREAGVIAAVNSEYFNRGKTLPLNIVIEPADGGAMISVTYSTPAGLSSPDEAVKDHLCQLITAARGLTAPLTTSVTTSAGPTRQQPASASRAPVNIGDLMLKSTEEVNAALKVTEVQAGQPMVMNRSVKLTYQALKPCRQLTLSGHSYTKEGIQLAPFIVATRFSVQPGQTFRDEFLVTYEKGHYVSLDRAICLR